MSKLGFEGDIEDLLETVPENITPELVDFLPKGYLSVSQARTYIKCGRQYELLYVKEKPNIRSFRAYEGVNVHRVSELVLQEKFNTGVDPSLEFAQDNFVSQFGATKEFVDDWEGWDEGAALDNGIRLINLHHISLVPTAFPIEVEKTFTSIVNHQQTGLRLPVIGRIDSIQAQLTELDNYAEMRLNEKIKPTRPRRIHDLKVTTNKWNEAALSRDLQFGTYAHVEGIPDVQVDQLVKGRAKVPKPRYTKLTSVISPTVARHSIDVMANAAKGIAKGHFPPTDPSNWWCDKNWCPVWAYCSASGGPNK